MVAGPDHGVAVGDDDLLTAADRPDDGAAGEMDILEGPVGDLRGLQGDEFEDLRPFIAERGDGEDLALADVVQDPADGGMAGVDHAVDADPRDERDVVDPVDQREDLPRAHLFGEERPQDVRLLVVGDGDEEIGSGDVLLPEELLAGPVAVQDDRLLQE